MDKTQRPGISLASVQLLECIVGNVNPSVGLKFDLGVTDLKRTLSSENKILEVRVAFDLMKGVEEPPCKFTCAYLAIYTRSPEASITWEEFKDHIAVAHLIPFVREFVSNVTMRMPLSALMLPPVNAHKLVEEYRQLSLSTPTTTTVS